VGSSKKQKGLAVNAGSSGGHVLVASMFASCLWYCFDDKLATPTGVDSLGTMGYPHVYAMSLFLCVLLSVAGMNWNAD